MNITIHNLRFERHGVHKTHVRVCVCVCARASVCVCVCMCVCVCIHTYTYMYMCNQQDQVIWFLLMVYLVFWLL